MHKGVALHPVTGPVLQVGDAEKFALALNLGSMDPLLSQQAQSWSCLTTIEEGHDKRLVQLGKLMDPV